MLPLMRSNQTEGMARKMELNAKYLGDYEAAQTAGHHVHCDGYMTSHRVTVGRNQHGTWEATCEECGKLGVGSFGQEKDCIRFQSGHSSEVACDGRCRTWA